MTCRECNAFLLDYCSGALAPEERTHFEAHLIWCSRCVVFLKTYEETIRLAKGAFSHPNETKPTVVPNKLVQAILAARARV